MAFENSQSFTIDSKKMVGIEQFENICRVEVLAEKPIKKVIHISALPKIVSSEKVGENIDFSGRTAYKIVYESEDGSLSSVETYVEWQNKIACGYDNYYLCPNIQENTVSGFSSNELAVSSLLNLEVFAIIQERLTPVSSLDGYVVDEKTYEGQRLVNTVRETFNDVLEQEYNGKIDEVLYYTADIKIKNVNPMVDSISVDGEFNVVINAIENGRIITITKTADFKQEFGALSVIPSNIVDAILRLNDLKVTASYNETDNKTNLIISIESVVYAEIYNKETITLVQDAFSIKKETKATYECVNADLFEFCGVKNDTVIGCFEVDKELYEVCFAVGASGAISEVKNQNDGVSIVGCCFVEAICETENREKVKVQGVVPFTVEVADIGEDDKVCINTKISSCKLRGQKEIEVVLEFNINYKKENNVCIGYLSQIEEVGDNKETTSAIKVYVVKEKEDLFAVAKAMLVRPEVITSQNPEIENNLSEGTRIVVYNGLDINF